MDIILGKPSDTGIQACWLYQGSNLHHELDEITYPVHTLDVGWANFC